MLILNTGPIVPYGSSVPDQRFLEESSRSAVNAGRQEIMLCVTSHKMEILSAAPLTVPGVDKSEIEGKIQFKQKVAPTPIIYQ